MRLTRVYLPTALAPGALVPLPDAQSQHVMRVLRLAVGARLLVFNGQGGEYEAIIESARRNSATLRIGARQEVASESPLAVTLLQGIARGEKMDHILQKSTELGVARIMPVTMIRSTVRLDAGTALRKQAHWQGVVISAAEQCGRDRVPEVAAPSELSSAMRTAGCKLNLLLAPDATALSLPELLATHRDDAAAGGICLLVGPEGGFDPAESSLAVECGFVACRLGPRVLRTETAALVALAALQVLAGDLR